MTGIIAGRGLHSGAASSVRFVRHEGPVVVRVGEVEVPVSALRVVDSTRSTTVADALGRVRIGTIEHLFAALGGLGIHEGVAVVIEGPEAPLCDGGARVYADALRAVGGPLSASGAVGSFPSEGRLRVVRDGDVTVGESRYELRCGEGVELEVAVDFGDTRIAGRARWSGDAEDFYTRIASARTFGFEHEIADLLARGLASHVTPESVVVIGRESILAAGAPFLADEPARHKLLDLIGDLYVHGGPPRGSVRAVRPGHAATHEVMRRALADGLVACK